MLEYHFKRFEPGPFVRVDVYRFDDTDPNRDPESIRLASQEFDLPLEPDGPWSEVSVELPESLTGGEANAAMLYLGLAPPEAGVPVNLNLFLIQVGDNCLQVSSSTTLAYGIWGFSFKKG